MSDHFGKRDYFSFIVCSPLSLSELNSYKLLYSEKMTEVPCLNVNKDYKVLCS